MPPTVCSPSGASACYEPRVPPARYLFLIAGILGVLAMFRPMIGIGRGPVRVELSAYELSFGLEKSHKALTMRLPLVVELKMPADVRETRDDLRLVAAASRTAALAYIPAGLILLIGAFGVWRKRSGRVEAAFAILFALISIGAWFGVRYGVAYGIEEEPALARLHFEPVFGAHVLLITGALAIVGGLLVLLGRDEASA